MFDVNLTIGVISGTGGISWQTPEDHELQQVLGYMNAWIQYIIFSSIQYHKRTPCWGPDGLVLEVVPTQGQQILEEVENS